MSWQQLIGFVPDPIINDYIALPGHYNNVPTPSHGYESVEELRLKCRKQKAKAAHTDKRKSKMQTWADNPPQTFVRAYNKSLKRWVVMTADSSPYARSLRRFRKKLRFNLAANIFVPNLFFDLTLDKKNYEDRLHLGEKISLSSWVRDFLHDIKKAGADIISYAWRVECGTLHARPHVHFLMQLATPPKIKFKQQWRPLQEEWQNVGIWTYHRFWTHGKITDARALSDDAQSHKIVCDYITKYMSKNEGEWEPDPGEFCGQRFNTSRNLIRPPPSMFKQPTEFQNLEFAHQAYDANIDQIQSEINERKSNPLFPDYYKIDLKAVYVKIYPYMHAQYWFEDPNAGAQMRDYIYKKQQQIEQNKELLRKKIRLRQAARILAGTDMYPDAIWLPPDPIDPIPIQPDRPSESDRPTLDHNPFLDIEF